MAQIDDLIAEVADPNLRSKIATAVATLRRRATFGLHFERHIPEYVTLPNARVRAGSIVGLRDGSHSKPLRVVDVKGDRIACSDDSEAGELLLYERDQLVVVKRTGEPIYPALRLIDSVTRSDAAARHVLIEGENHGVLQLLHWTTNSRFDCIYIDPPYNTGARDWKYNNNYVDVNDSFKSSKWLSMMERRLVIARSLLKPTGVLIIAIDDYEYSNLMLLLQSDRLFRGWNLETAVLQNNPRGGGGSHISNTHEYAIFVIPPGTKLSPIELGIDEKRDYRRRGRGDRNLRTGRPNSFYAIHVDPATRRAVSVGPALGRDDPYETGPTEDGLLRIYPLGREGLERVWRNSREGLERRLLEGVITLELTSNDTIVQVIAGEQKSVPIRSIWSGPRYNAGEQGTNLVKALTGVEFDYPKSLYSVFDCIRAVVGDRPDAMLLDYFGGSGTTAHAAMLLNRLDEGRRQTVLVTNNEIGEPQERAFRAAGISPNDHEWQAAGICRSVTFPRCRNAILGTGPNGVPIDWDYDTGTTIDVDEAPLVETLPFLDPVRFRDAKLRASLASWVQIKRNALSAADGFYVAPAEGCRDGIKGQAILFDPDRLTEFVDALAEAEHVSRIWLATAGNARRDSQIRDEVVAATGTRVRQVPLMRKAREGFPENLAYLRLEYLDPGAVEIGRHLNELLPTLWLMAGAHGAVPIDAEERPFLVPTDASFALLIDASAVVSFREAIDEHGRVCWAFIITDSAEAFQEIAAMLPPTIPPTQRVQLYRDYLGNFSINMVET